MATGAWRFLPLIDDPKGYDGSYRLHLPLDPAALFGPAFDLPSVIANSLRREQTHLLENSGAATTQLVFEYDLGLHFSLMQASNNRFFADAALRVTTLRRVVGYDIALDHARTPGHYKQHLAILSPVEDYDNVSASQLLARHLKTRQRSKTVSLANWKLLISGLHLTLAGH